MKIKRVLSLLLSLVLILSVTVPGTLALEVGEETTAPTTESAVPETTVAAETSAQTESTEESLPLGEGGTMNVVTDEGNSTSTTEPAVPETTEETPEETTEATEPSVPETTAPVTEPTVPETTEVVSALTEEQKALFVAILECRTHDEYMALMASADPALVDAMSAAMNEEENYILSTHMATLNEVAVIPMATSVVINDTIITNGCLTADPQGGDLNDVDYTYQWYVSENGTTFTEIKNTSTVTGTAQTMYVARDGARKYYKVKITYNGESVESAAFQVEYYDALMNGSFEQPVNSGTNAGPQYRESAVPYWKTTGKGTGSNTNKDIEILSVLKSDSIDNFNLTERQGDENLLTATTRGSGSNTSIIRYTGVVEGTQCAELNCENWGALYQDVLTEPGSTLYWSFYHRGRFGMRSGSNYMDEMQLIIIDADQVTANWNPAGSSNTEGVVMTSQANALEWKGYSGEYIVPEGQYVTRFYFVSTKSYNSGTQSTGTNATVGNYLDHITFSDEVPDPIPNYSNITVKKEVAEQFKSIIPDGTFTFTVQQGSTTKTVTLPDDGKWEATLMNLEPGEWTVTETTWEVAGLTYGNTTVNGTEGKSVTANLTKGTGTTVTFNNTYTESNVTINYVPSPAAGGRVSLPTETLGVLTGTAQGSTATANTGYTFKGWYNNAEGTGDALSTDTKYTPAKVDGKNVAATYYAVFIPNEYDYVINYLEKDTNAVLKAQDTKKATYGTIVFEIAPTIANYTYHSVTDSSTPDDGQITIGISGNVITFYYTQNEATLNYVAKVFDSDGNLVSGETGCTVDPKSEVVSVVTGVAQGSIASTTNDAYRFDGWYSNEACTLNIGSDAKYVPTKGENELWVDGTTYYAKFVPNKTSMTIKKTGTAFDARDSFIFDVYDGETCIATVSLKMGGEITIEGVIIGKVYTVRERTVNTRYYAHADQTVTPGMDISKNVATFSNSVNENKWLTATDSMKNVFNGSSDD